MMAVPARDAMQGGSIEQSQGLNSVATDVNSPEGQ